eukprot:1671782-Amphidinium_carterae.2
MGQVWRSADWHSQGTLKLFTRDLKLVSLVQHLNVQHLLSSGACNPRPQAIRSVCKVDEQNEVREVYGTTEESIKVVEPPRNGHDNHTKQGPQRHPELLFKL